MLSSISLRHMRVFVAVADHGTFTAAAEVLGLTPSGLTATIRQFEDVAGTPLFDRTTRQVTLSATGARFLPTARRLISEFEEALGDLDALSKGIGGTIRIAAAPSVLTRILPGVISRFVDEHPDARLRLDELNAGEVHEAVARNEADFGIAGEWHALPDIAFSPLFSDRFGVLCRSTHAFARRSAIAWSELADQAFVGLGPESGTRAMMAAPGSWAGGTGGAAGSGGGGAGDVPVDPAEVAASDVLKRAAALGLPEAQMVLRRANASERAIERVAKMAKPRQSDAGQNGSGGGAKDGPGSAMIDPVAQLRPIVETSNTLTLAAMVAEGVGITVLPELAARVADLAAPGKLAFVPLCEPIRKRPIGIITRQSRSLSPIARIFLAMVMEQAPKMDLPAAIEWG
ncbi:MULTISPECIES: LysR family transcriptional regulator [Thalassospira]|uniref:LysR family transcriptional regulator n=2 Tax=Thalassospiraceae TaxID=2844866 RepID=UPI0008DDFA43|nr:MULTISPECIES: LysR family transcriptional regulator [Thalassospira]MDM7978682.1 LysR substrate-binding domain-containing protein [Thalassospira xiamenensis]OHZ00477.1 LysR family transcriptional regulator [Thalassospira sp. MIT1004]HBS21616.1 LysR family transcriptional regulator [Thalassospira sp.]